MSIQIKSDEGWIISHLNYLNNLYDNVYYDTDGNHKLLFNEKVFNINSPFLRHNQIPKISDETLQIIGNKKSTRRNKKSKSSEFTKEVQLVEETFQRILSLAKDKKVFSNSQVDYNEEARKTSKDFYTNSVEESLINFHGGNQLENSVIRQVGSTQYVFPKNSYFYSYDVKNIGEKLQLDNQFDFILMDPPWWNKFIRRNSGYKMMYNADLCSIPINKLIGPTGIVGIWCTNSETHYHDIINTLFPSWNLKLVGKWYWIKVTQSGETICDFNDKAGKQPYELLLFGTPVTNTTSKIPSDKLLISVPSAIHSHKPPISEVIQEYLPENPNCLELFARYLLPNWTSWGLEVLKFQRLSLYTSQKINSCPDLAEKG